MADNARQVLGVTRAAAVVTTLLIGAGSFVLSWAALRDLAARAGWSPHLAWVWPLIVDGAILMGTMGVVALAPYPRQAGSRRFIWRVLAASAAFSIGCNALHAVIPRTAPINPWLAAMIAVVPPSMLLAATHILALLARVRADDEPAVSVGTPPPGQPTSEEPPRARADTARAHVDAPQAPADTPRPMAAPARPMAAPARPVAATPRPPTATPDPLAPTARPPTAGPRPSGSVDDTAAVFELGGAPGANGDHLEVVKSGVAAPRDHTITQQGGWTQLAAIIAGQAVVKGTTVEEITEVLHLSYERELSHRSIGRQLTMDHRTVGKIVAASADLLRSARVQAG